MTLVADRAPRAEFGLRRTWYGARRIYELRTDIDANPALAAVLCVLGPGRYNLMAPHFTSTFIAQDAAWSGAWNHYPPVMLWSRHETPPRCTLGCGPHRPGCRWPLLHEGPCDDGILRT